MTLAMSKTKVLVVEHDPAIRTRIEPAADHDFDTISPDVTPTESQALDSIICQGSIVSGGQVERSILGPNVRVNSYAKVEGSILFESVDIGRHARVRRAIIDKGVRIPPNTSVGYDIEHDRARGFTVSENGVTVIAKADGIEHFAESEMVER